MGAKDVRPPIISDAEYVSGEFFRDLVGARLQGVLVDALEAKSLLQQAVDALDRASRKWHGDPSSYDTCSDCAKDRALLTAAAEVNILPGKES